MFNFAELAYVFNGTKVALLNAKNAQYLSLNNSNNKFKCNGVHPYLINKEFENEIKASTDFTLVLSSMPNYSLNTERSIITFGTQISFMTSKGEFLVATNNGELKVESLKGDGSLSSMNLPVNSKFTIIDPKNQSNFSKPLLFNDAIVLRSTFGGYLTLSNQDISEDGEMNSVASNGMIMIEDSIWKIVKTDVPYTPDWIYKRKFLNYNVNSYLYNLDQSLNNNSKSRTMATAASTKKMTSTNTKDKPGLCSQSTSMQDKLLVEDILLTMLGMEGNYIKRIITHTNFSDFKVEFQIEPYLESPTADPPLVRLVDLMLPLSFYYDSLTHFLNININNFETGLVAKGFCHGLKKLLREYVLFVNQLDCQNKSSSPLNLQQLWWLCQPCLKLLENLHKLCQNCSMVKGGALINIIYSSYLHETDTQMKKMYKFLLNKGFAPFFDMLKLWVCFGSLDKEHDFQEFMIWSPKDFTLEITKDYYLDLFWELKFKLNQIHVPEFLTRLSEKILFIGKSLNIIRACGKIIQCPFEKEFESFSPKKNYSGTEETTLVKEEEKNNESSEEMIFENEQMIKFEKLINDIYKWTNETLKTVLFKEKSLESLIKSFKRFYLLESGDFYSYLIELASDVFDKEKKEINLEKLQTNIDNAIRSTSANLDPNKDQFYFDLSDLVITMEKKYLDKYDEIINSNEDINDINKLLNNLRQLDNNKPQTIEIKVWESLVLESKISWPLNLIFSKTNIIKYKILFRHLLRLKVIEKQLTDVWMAEQNFKEFDLQNYFKLSYFLSDNMLNFIKNLIYYFFNEVIEPNYLMLINNLVNSNSMEDVMNNHTKFLDACLKNCLVQDENVFAEMNNVIQCCSIYSRVIRKMYNSAILTERDIHQKNIGLLSRTRLNYYEKNKKRLEERNQAIESVFIKGNISFNEFVPKFQKGFEGRLKCFVDLIKKLNEK